MNPLNCSRKHITSSCQIYNLTHHPLEISTQIFLVGTRGRCFQRHISVSATAREIDYTARKRTSLVLINALQAPQVRSLYKVFRRYSHDNKDESKESQEETTDDVSELSKPAKRGKDLRNRMASTIPGMHRAVIALGSNLGDRVKNIENALDGMKAKGLKIVKLSRLYETEPMYYENQDMFINGTVLVETDLQPLALLDLLQQTENELGRTRDIEKGPRTIDLDIVLYGQEVIDHERLQVPHPLLLERHFVLKPMCDIVPLETFPEDFVNQHKLKTKDNRFSISDAWKKLKQKKQIPLISVTYLSPSSPFLPARYFNKLPLIMSILNITPDSFSDGGHLGPQDLETITTVVRSRIAAGANVLDIGGQSTRPGATLLSAEEELSRILPVLRHIKSNISEAKDVAISIDTFHSSVVRACAQEDLFDIVNDVSAGLMDSDMLSTVAELRKTIVLMHMRGTPETMNKLVQYPDGVVQGVAKELKKRVIAAEAAGIPPWRIILDPGIGFAKTTSQNLQLLREGTNQIAWIMNMKHLPWLVGTSRKGFIGKITGVKEADRRMPGTAACVAAAVMGGADIVRVHDVRQMAEVAKMAVAIRDGWADPKVKKEKNTSVEAVEVREP